MAEQTSPVNVDELTPYLSAGYTLMPLHVWDRKSEFNGKEREDGKRPVHNDWTRRNFDAQETIDRAREHGNNVGVRLRAEQLVIDVDPRNMKDKDADGEVRDLKKLGMDTFEQLCEDIGLKPDMFPTVNTGSGGFHLYMTKPDNVPVVDTLKDYPGVEFKTRGRQVVAAGSRHPNGRMYEWDFLRPSLEDGVPKAPDDLLDLIRRPARMDGSSGSEGQEYTQQEVAELLSILDPLDYAENDRWLELMMACHHASGGEARSEFIEWSTRDPAYEGDAWLIGRRWDSLTAEGTDGAAITYKTLNKRVNDVLNTKGEEARLRSQGVDVDAAVTAMRGDAAADFDDDLPDDGDDPDVPKHEKKSALEQINDEYWAVSNGGSFRVMKSVYDPVMKREEWQAFKVPDFKMFLADRPKIKYIKRTENAKGDVVEKEETIAQADAWLQWKKRRTAQGVLFDPSGAAHKGWLNMWRGFAVQPEKGDWSYLKELMFEGLCAGNQEHYDFLVRWMAYMVKRPHLPAEVAVCFRGDKGTGKGTLGDALLKLTGRHGVHATSPKHVTGDFNSHLMECVFLFADEAVGPRDRNAQAMMKSLITDRTKVYEPKGLDIRQGKNHVHVMIASNDDWFVDASVGDGERRYHVSEVSPRYQGNTRFFDRVYGEIEGSGVSAMLFDLLAMDLGTWVPRSNIPDSDALTEQKMRNMGPVEQWWLKTLARGEFEFDWAPGPAGSPAYDPIFDEEPADAKEWGMGAVRAFRQEVLDDYGRYCHSLGMRNLGVNKSMGKFFWGELKKVCPSLETERQIRIRVPDDNFTVTATKSDGRASAVEFPPLDQCRREMEDAIGGRINWHEWAD